jgi:hypothetical protein
LLSFAERSGALAASVGSIPQTTQDEDVGGWASYFLTGQGHDNQLQCDECERAAAVVHCQTCEQPLCSGCDTRLHSRGKLLLHDRRTLSSQASTLLHNSLGPMVGSSSGVHRGAAPLSPLGRNHFADPNGIASPYGQRRSAKQCDECDKAKAVIECSTCEQPLCEVSRDQAFLFCLYVCSFVS